MAPLAAVGSIACAQQLSGLLSVKAGCVSMPVSVGCLGGVSAALCSSVTLRRSSNGKHDGAVLAGPTVELERPTLLLSPSPLDKQVSGDDKQPAPPCQEEWQRERGSDLLAFLRGEGADSCGRTLQELRSMDFESMERVHNYIQWMFPTDEASEFNADAPALTLEAQEAIREDSELQQELRVSLARFCEFLGLEVQVSQDDGAVLIAEAPHFFDRWQHCWTSRRGRNHNWLRISRVLLCLGRCGLFAEQAALYQCLERLHEDGVNCGSALSFWRQRSQSRPLPSNVH